MLVQRRDLVTGYKSQAKNIGSQVAMMDANIEAIAYGLETPDESNAIETALREQYGAAATLTPGDIAEGPPPEKVKE